MHDQLPNCRSAGESDNGNSFARIRLFSRVRLSQSLHRNATGSGIADKSWQENWKRFSSRRKSCELNPPRPTVPLSRSQFNGSA
jgi:hypothetical protein